ncbi:hypothetical protein LINGRAHAP2_LOCUS13507 [Linum grandiflorum]
MKMIFAPSKFPWTYSANETSYLLEGKATVYPEGSEEGVEIGAGDLIDFRKGMSCTWEVSVAVYKHLQVQSVTTIIRPYDSQI